IHSGVPFAKKGDSDLSLPKMDIPINVLEWEVFLPEQYKVKDFGGDALSASLWPAAYPVGIGQEGGVGPGSGGGVAGGTFYSSISGMPSNGRGLLSLMMLSPGIVALGNGQLGGVVIDPAGAVVPGARVEVQNTAVRFARLATTGPDGRWSVSDLP